MCVKHKCEDIDSEVRFICYLPQFGVIDVPVGDMSLGPGSEGQMALS